MNDFLLNSRLRTAFQQIQRIPHFSGAHGDSVDSTLFKKLNEHIKAKRISAEVWKDTKAYELLRPLCQRKIFQFPVEVPEPLIVDKPNGSQNWPDALILFKSKGLPIEFKSSKGDKILWNSGLPQPEGIYIFNGASSGRDQQTTFFLGRALLTEDERRILIEASDQNHEHSKGYNDALAKLDSKWSLYPRPMYNCGEKYLGHPDREKREQEVLDFIDGFVWENTALGPATT